ncbi:prepilin-type N-terminal cleavage/methylation domain-containing protein [Enterovibrio calviensis]|uniref:prepilin-type N-terminal cleavage/methylation domain-containing protein n=1 Tax=Enterovibrio calviensis TaxID=91359 RepID=UPI000686D6C4|nr:prepilin-type N-terminal cleavage/methylation domain-containing protein [Enterovibrio calviensis]
MKQKGFSVLELVVVIVIMGILGAVAIPKLLPVVDTAKEAVATELQSTLKESARIAHVSESLELMDVVMVHDYPAALASGITASLMDIEEWNVTYTKNRAVFTLKADEDCKVVYREAKSNEPFKVRNQCNLVQG